MVGFLFFVLHFVHVMHLISCHHVNCICIRVRLMHPSIFPVVRFAIRRSYLLRCTPLVFFRVRVSNFLGMDRGLSSGLIIPPGDYRSSFVPFGGRLVLQRLTGHPQSPFECPAKNPSKTSPKPTNLSSMLLVVRSRSCGQKPHLIWSLLAPSTYIKALPFHFRE